MSSPDARAAPPIRLVATDLDGTLLRTTYHVSERTVAALRRVQEAGARVVPVTARAPWGTEPIAAEFGIAGHAVCNSGVTIYDLDRRTVVEQHLLEPAVTTALVRALRAAIPGIVFAATREAGYAREPEYVPGVPPPEGHVVADALTFLDRPVPKLVMKVPETPPEAILPIVRAHADGLQVGTSGGPFVEVMPPGATKDRGLARLCEILGIDAREVVAFGDYSIDVGMLRWAGWGVAPANALPEVLAAADEVSPSNDEDGVASVLERLLDAGQIG